MTLTIVTITYDDTAGLGHTLESLQSLWQTPSRLHFEHVVVEAAPEWSRPALDRLPPAWPLVRVEQAPRGVPDAFNRAVAVARGRYVWFLNAGDSLRDARALANMVDMLDRDPSIDLVCGGAYLCRDGRPLYPQRPRPTLVRNLLGRSWMCHQAVVYRKSSLERVGPFSTSYRAAGDYDFHLRCYIAGARARFIPDVVVNYDMSGGSNDVLTVFSEFKLAQRRHRRALPAWVNCVNEVVRPVEYARMSTMRRLAATWIGASLRPVWATVNRGLREARARRAS